MPNGRVSAWLRCLKKPVRARTHASSGSRAPTASPAAFRSLRQCIPDTLVVNQMNGEKLPAKHGFPLRAMIPGWYGMDSVKWLRAIEVLTAPEARSGLREAGALPAGRNADRRSRYRDAGEIRFLAARGRGDPDGPALHRSRRRVGRREPSPAGRGQHGRRKDVDGWLVSLRAACRTPGSIGPTLDHKIRRSVRIVGTGYRRAGPQATGRARIRPRG